MTNFGEIIKTINRMPEALAAEQYEAMKSDPGSRGEARAGMGELPQGAAGLARAGGLPVQHYIP
jgi:hypothetical protein